MIALAFLRNSWRALTSMRTALVLLFLLAVAAVPGAVLPQKDLNIGKVDRWIEDHPDIGPWLDKLKFFEIFISPWFTAIYALLFVSLVGCLAPRLVEQCKQLRAPLTRTPRNLSRLPHHARLRAADSELAKAQVKAVLRGWRTEVHDTERGWELSAERGFVHEFGNVLFHFALLGILVAIALGRLWGYEGTRTLIAGPGTTGFCNTSTSVYDSFRGGLLEDGTRLDPFCLQAKSFHETFLASGQPDNYESQIAYQLPADFASDSWHGYQLRVNHPLRVEGLRVYLMGHGFAPTFTVTWPDGGPGKSRTETVPFIPQDGATFLSSGAARFDPPAGMWPDLGERDKHAVALEGLFAPTAGLHGTLLTSLSPELVNPGVAIDVYEGDTGLNSGRPQSATSLDHRLVDSGKLVRAARKNLMRGESVTLPDGVIVRFDGVQQWVSLQVSKDPAQLWVLLFAVTMVCGLLGSLVVRRRRVWARFEAAELELGGLARTDQAGWHGEFDKLAARVRQKLGAETA
ncbi:ResB family protein [Segniliparus rotundus DSM 44985]|uniref:ResB family protein n=1 Tax=Segniliparus rotundus (strain ATCC BAA-972 / CDC 1076 / CIP 108378 / DSM 44985 / JCM 13578) TaxID=640132 RepID=D6Z872_SEGRD|nr:cytochrome c biogenesis protein ResB [Segniliparus rotundus]ADG98152.1 ResB family protein [Segniliparus rotundus DSM 44985]